MITNMDILNKVTDNLLNILTENGDGSISVTVAFNPTDRGYDTLYVDVEGSTEVIKRRDGAWVWEDENGQDVVGDMEHVIEVCATYLMARHVVVAYNKEQGYM